MSDDASRPSRRETMALLAGALALPARAAAQPPCPDEAAIARAAAPLLALLPETAVRAGLPEAADGGAAAQRCDDWSPEGDAALALATAALAAAVPAGCPSPAARAARALADRATASAAVRYGRNDPLAGLHRPYRVTAYAGPAIDTPAAMALAQDAATPAAVDAWQAKLDRYADALLGAARGLRADEAAGCRPPVTTSRAALAAMDRFAATAPDEHPLVLALPADARPRAAATLARRIQPAMALLRDGTAAITRAGRAEIGLWAQPDGETLHAANLARAGDTAMTPEDAQRLARDEAERVAALLDRRLAARGLRTGTLAERIAAAFAARPGLLAIEDRDALVRAAADKVAAGHALLPRIVPPALATIPPPAVRGLSTRNPDAPDGSVYLPAPATLWVDDRSAYALPVPGVSPLAFHLALPGRHLLAGAAANGAMPAIVRAADWPGMTRGWGCYAERLAAEQGLFRTDPWGDIARLADELLRAARLVVDIGIHRQRWPRERAEAEMTTLTGAPQSSAIDRIVALPGEAAAYTLGLARILALRDAARGAAGKRFDAKAFHAAVLDGGARPFGLVTA